MTLLCGIICLVKSLTSKARSLPSYPSGAALIRGEASKMFLALEAKSHTEVAYEFGLDRYFTSEGSMRSAVTRAYNTVLENPSTYDILPEKAAYIQGIVTSRAIVKKPETIRKVKEIENMDIATIMLSTRDLAAGLVRRKLEYLDTHPQALKEEKLKDLGRLLGVLFDKGQIIAGQATEHVLMMSSIPDHLDPDEALAAIMKMREEFNNEK
jgi:hypothetical protein